MSSPQMISPQTTPPDASAALPVAEASSSLREATNGLREAAEAVDLTAVEKLLERATSADVMDEVERRLDALSELTSLEAAVNSIAKQVAEFEKVVDDEIAR